MNLGFAGEPNSTSVRLIGFSNWHGFYSTTLTFSGKPNPVGKGRIIPGSYFPEDYQSVSLEKDLIIEEIPDANFAHRKIGEDDLYFVYHRDDIKYFSGTYRTILPIAATWLADDKRVLLDLGTVNIAAEVIINGENAGMLWKPPFKIDVTDQVKAGNNRIEIRVTNLWANRLIGDESLEDTSGYDYRKYVTEGPMPRWYVNNEPMPEGPRSTFTTANFYRTDRTLLPSGLLGPVVLKQETIHTLNAR